MIATGRLRGCLVEIIILYRHLSGQCVDAMMTGDGIGIIIIETGIRITTLDVMVGIVSLEEITILTAAAEIVGVITIVTSPRDHRYQAEQAFEDGAAAMGPCPHIECIKYD